MTYTITPRPHIVRVPRHTILLRLFQLFVATTILILTSYGVSVLAEDGILLTLVAGRPLPLDFHEEDFSTHSHMGNMTTQDVAVLPTNTTINCTAVQNSTAASAATTSSAHKKFPSLLPKIWFRDAQSQNLRVIQVPTGTLLPNVWNRDTQAPKVVELPTGPQYWESGREILDTNIIPFNEMNFAKLCPIPAYLGAPASAYPFDPNAPSVPGQEPDLHDGMRNWDVLSITATRTVKSLVKRLLKEGFQPGWKGTERVKHIGKRIDEGKSLRKIFKDDAREYLRTNVHIRSSNPWGSPIKKAFVTPAPETMMWGHLQTAILSIIHLVLVLLTTHCPTFAKAYDYPLLYILEAFLLLLWLISFCVLSAQIMVAQSIGYGTACSEDSYCYTYASFDKRIYFLRLMSGCTALTALMFLLYLVSFIVFTMSVRKHRREGGAKKPLSEESKHAHPGPFSFDETGELEEARNNTTDEEAGKPGKRSTREKVLAKKQKKAKKEDERAIRHMRKGGTSDWEKSVGKKHGTLTRNGVLTNEEPRRDRGKGKRPKTHSKLSMCGFERKQMALSLGDLEGPVLGRASLEGGTDTRERGRERSEMEPPKQMTISLGDLGRPILGREGLEGGADTRERGRQRSEMEPAQVAPYARGGDRGGEMF